MYGFYKKKNKQNLNFLSFLNENEYIQGEPATHASRYFGAGCFVDMRGKETDTYSTVQLLNSHPVMCGEFAFSPQDGAIISCGADGTVCRI